MIIEIYKKNFIVIKNRRGWQSLDDLMSVYSE